MVMGQEFRPGWLGADWLLGQFGHERNIATQAYREFILSGKGVASPLSRTRHQLLLGDKVLVDEHRRMLNSTALREASMAHRRSAALPLDEYMTRYPARGDAMAQDYLTGAYTMAEIAQHFWVHYMTVSRAVRKFEASSKAMFEVTSVTVA